MTERIKTADLPCGMRRFLPDDLLAFCHYSHMNEMGHASEEGLHKPVVVAYTLP
jgi:hypothetical protein